ncbi:hypothetical protein BH11PSE4_BH11PSE4_23540 [soil metagenome]
MLPDEFPARALSTLRARKDVGYALDPAASVGIRLQGAELADHLLGQSTDAGFGDLYWPVLARVVAARGDKDSKKFRACGSPSLQIRSSIPSMAVLVLLA